LAPVSIRSLFLPATPDTVYANKSFGLQQQAAPLKTKVMKQEQEIAIWGGLECTINRVRDQYLDQSQYSGHYTRGTEDIDRISELGIRALRYPVLWERHQPGADSVPDWTFVAGSLDRMQELGITPIVGLVHHGSGPAWVNFFDGSFEAGLARYARLVAERFPWVEYYTPVNEPLTTARFCGLYGHWYPHGTDELTLYRILLAECRATVLAMEAIRTVNPDAKLIGTEDLCKCHSTELLQYQAEFENERRWVSYELLCGTLTPEKLMYQRMLAAGISAQELDWFLEHSCVPHIAGFNYYLTSERYLDEDFEKYPECFHGGNGRHRYADIHTVHAPLGHRQCGAYYLLREAWDRLQIPLAITECHLHSTREDQMRWFHSMWKTLKKVKADGVDVRAITAWALFGLYGWNKLVTEPGGDYEPGVFNLASGTPRPTALATYIRELTGRQSCEHPILEREGWWERDNRLIYGDPKVVPIQRNYRRKQCQPLLVLGRSGTLGRAFARICEERNIHYVLAGRETIDLSNPASITSALDTLQPWAVINAAGYVNVDGAETDAERCIDVNAAGPAALAAACAERSVKLLAFSSDLVFDGKTERPYLESGKPSPLNVYGRSKAEMEGAVLEADPNAIIIRSSSFFGPWDEYNFLYNTLHSLKEGKALAALSDVTVSPTYVPDLVHTSLDLLLDAEQGIFHVTNGEALTWEQFARQIALQAGYDERLVRGIAQQRMRLPALRPRFSALQSEKGIQLPQLQDAIERCLDALGAGSRSERIAV
jgi:dTDP-4-dehydrorhamnose reductase